MISAYGRAYQERTDPTRAEAVERELYDITGTNGRCQNLRNGLLPHPHSL